MPTACDMPMTGKVPGNAADALRSDRSRAPASTIRDDGCPIVVQHVPGVLLMPSARPLCGTFLYSRQEQLQVVRQRRSEMEFIAAVIGEGDRLRVQKQALQSCRFRRLVG